MPELPEVESLARFLNDRLCGRVILGVEVGAISALKTFSPAPQELRGATVLGVTRHGKWLDLALQHDVSGNHTDEAKTVHLIVHLARAGWLRWSEASPAAPLRPGRSPQALRIRLDDGSGFDLTEAGTHKRLSVYVVNDPTQVPRIATLGVDPLSELFTVDRLVELLAARNQQIKGLLRDQSTIAGIGNAYSDEILLIARTSPFALTASFDHEHTTRLYEAVISVLAEAVATTAGRPAAELKDAKRRGMRVHGRNGEPCPGWDGTPCGDTVHEVSFADSALQYCPTCQTGGKPLADRRMSRLLR